MRRERRQICAHYFQIPLRAAVTAASSALLDNDFVAFAKIRRTADEPSAAPLDGLQLYFSSKTRGWIFEPCGRPQPFPRPFGLPMAALGTREHLQAAISKVMAVMPGRPNRRCPLERCVGDHVVHDRFSVPHLGNHAETPIDRRPRGTRPWAFLSSMPVSLTAVDSEL
jgi:hypothetical protein